MEPLLVLTNAEAGSNDAASLEAALEVLRASCSVEVAATSDVGELNGVLHRAGSRRLVVAGGDGSLHAVISALYRRGELAAHTLGLLPLGTGNDFARAQGIPLDVVDAAQVVVDGMERSVDLIVDEVGEVVVNSVHVGAGAAASRYGARWKSRLGSLGVGPLNLGKLGYPIGAAIASLRPAAIRLRVEVDGEVVVDLDDRLLMVALGNGTSVGGGTELTPDADPGDGLVDVMIAREVGWMGRSAQLVDLVRARHEERDDVVVARGREVSLSGEEFWWSADGELDGPERHRTWHVEPGAYRMTVPA